MVLAQPLQRPFERVMRALSRHLPKAVEGEVEPLHQGRVATRRLREVLPLCGCEVPRGVVERAERRARRVGRALGAVREVDVSIEVVDGLLQTQAVDVDAKHLLLRHLRDERDERHERMIGRLTSVSTRKLERDLAEIARVLGMRRQTDAWAQLLAVRMSRRAQRVQRAVREAGALYISDRVHAVRIASKKLRYTLELAGDTGEAAAKQSVRRLKEIQDVLGRLHDFEVLGAAIQDLTAPVPASRDNPTAGALEALRLSLDRECRELHSQYVASRESLLAVCEEAIATAIRIWVDRGGDVSSTEFSHAAGPVLKMTIPIERRQPLNRK